MKIRYLPAVIVDIAKEYDILIVDPAFLEGMTSNEQDMKEYSNSHARTKAMQIRLLVKRVFWLLNTRFCTGVPVHYFQAQK